MTHWGDLNARARGLAGHLVAEETLEALARAADLGDFVRLLIQAGLGPLDQRERDPARIELSFRREAAAHLRLLLRWLAERTPLLRVLIEDEDRRSLRSLVRGAAAAAPSESRLAGLIPTPGLPERLLEELARQPRVQEIAAVLAATRHPYAGSVQAGVGQQQPDLLRIEIELNRVFSSRARAGARKGGRELRAFVESVIDGQNLITALQLRGQELEWPAEQAFLEGGRVLSREGFLKAVASPTSFGASRLLAEAFTDREIPALITRHFGSPETLEGALHRHRIATLRRRARLAPLSPAPLLWYLLRLRRQSVRLRALLWGVAMGAPLEIRLHLLEEVA
jgi:vacuolar-type H+-ATPase subunit C/Vma6